MKSIILFTLFLMAISAPAQDDTKAPVIDPLRYAPSPTAAELGRYGQVPVGLFTGTPEVNVPLFELRTKNLSLPLSLNYRSNGFLVNKVASQVGFDWSLLAGGVITRVSQGIPDDKGSTNVRFGNEYPVDINKRPEDWTTEEKASVENYFCDWHPHNDTQPDMYAFNFAGYTGQFYYNDRHQFVTVPYQKLNIRFSSGHYPGFEITTPDGVQYHFVVSENTRITGASGWDGSSTNSSFALAKIIHPEGDEIRFYYKSSGYYNYQTSIVDNEYLVENPDADAPDEQQCEVRFGLMGIMPYAEANRSLIWPTIIDSICADGYAAIKFVTANDRRDVPELRIRGLKIYDSRGALARVVELHHQHLYSDNYSNSVATQFSGPGEEDVHYRLFLDSVLIKDAANTTMQRYAFRYNNLDELPIRLGYCQDHWGIFNGADNRSLLPDLGIETSVFKPTRATADREPHGAFAEKGMLNRITYPTGGYTEFEYEPHHVAGGNAVLAGGVRIKRQTDHTETGALASSRYYVYKRGGSGAPGNLHYYSAYSYTSFCEYSDETVRLPYMRPFRVNVYWIKSYSSSASNSGVQYGEVEVYRDSDHEFGREVHEFDIAFDDVQPHQQYGQYPISNETYTNFGWNAGKKKKETYFNQRSQRVKEVEYNYFVDTRKSDTTDFVQIQFTSKDESNVCPFSIGSYFNVKKYSILANWQYLQSRIERTFDSNGGNPVETRTDYAYENENHAQLTRESGTSSDGTAVEKRISYPQDYGAVSNFETLINRFLVAKPVDLRVYKNSKLISGYQTQYNHAGQPANVYVLESTDGADVAWNASVPYTFRHRTTYQYDDAKTLVAVLPDNNIPTTYVWSYKNTLPVAKIENATPAAVASALAPQGQNFLLALREAIEPAEIDAKLSQLRLRLKTALPKALVTTFVHKPLAGVASTTDPNGRATFFEYDDFSRLKLIKDNDENVVKGYRYSYIAPDKIPRLSVSAAQLKPSYTSTELPLTVHANGAWRISADQPWISISSASGNGTAAITIGVTENLAFTNRAGRLTLTDMSGNHLADQYVLVEQGRHPDYVAVNPRRMDFTPAGGSRSLSITSEVAWSLATNQSWLNATPTSGMGNASVTVTAGEHTTQVDRVATITVRDESGHNSADQVITIRQDGLPSHITLDLAELTFTATAATKSFRVTSNVSWAASANQPWLTVSPASGSNNATISVTAAANTGTTARTAVVSVRDQSGGNNLGQVLVNQPGLSDFIRLSPAILYLTSSRVDGTFDIFSNLTWNARIHYHDGSDWLDDIFPRSGLGEKRGVKVHVNTLPPPGETWEAEIEVYNAAKGKSEKILVNVTN